MVGERGLEPPTPWSRTNNGFHNLLSRLGLFCVLYPPFPRHPERLDPIWTQVSPKLPSSPDWRQHEDQVAVTVNRAASDLARLSSAASLGSVTVSRGRPCSARSRHSSSRALNSLAFLLSAVRWLTLRDHFTEECECCSDELASRLCHTRAASEPLCLLLLALLFRLVNRGVGPSRCRMQVRPPAH
jgi:hypothetical protein